MTISLFDTAENTLGKGKNAVYQHFSPFPQCFQKSSSLRSGSCGKGLIMLHDVTFHEHHEIMIDFYGFIKPVLSDDCLNMKGEWSFLPA